VEWLTAWVLAIVRVDQLRRVFWCGMQARVCVSTVVIDISRKIPISRVSQSDKSDSSFTKITLS